MSKAAETKAAESRPIIGPEYFSGEGSYEDWIDQFESTVQVTNNFTHAWHFMRGTTQFFAWLKKIARGTGHCHAWKKDFHAMTLPRVEF